MLTSTKPEPKESIAKAAPPLPAGGLGTPPPAGHAAITEHGVSNEVAPQRERDEGRIILYERLTGEAARKRAMSLEPQGAGMPPEVVEKVEYLEVWSTPDPADGYDFRLYSFGGALIASRSTRGH